MTLLTGYKVTKPDNSCTENTSLLREPAFESDDGHITFETAWKAEANAMHKSTISAALVWCAVTLLVGLMASATWAAPNDSPSGTWLTANGHSVVEIAQCGDALCGRIVGIDRAPNDPMPTDVNGRPQCGLTIITNEKPDGDGTWLGKVTDPRDGNRYQAMLWIDGEGNLRLRGFIGIPVLGATQTWHRFTGHLGDQCQLA
jgi:uncharacterized protein (DUF2147 family)